MGLLIQDKIGISSSLLVKTAGATSYAQLLSAGRDFVAFSTFLSHTRLLALA